MERLQLKVSARQAEVNPKTLRASGYTPAVLYNHGNTDHIQVANQDIRKIFAHGVSESTLIDLDIDGKTETAFVKDFQMHPLTEEILHMDFYRVTFGEKIKTHIPIHLTGKSAGEKEGGILEVFLHDVEIETFPRHLVPALEVDISNLQLGDSIHVSDLPLPPDTKVLMEGNPAICHIAKAAKMQETADTEETTEEEKG